MLLKLDLNGAIASGVAFCKPDNGVFCQRKDPVRLLVRSCLAVRMGEPSKTRLKRAKGARFLVIIKP